MSDYRVSDDVLADIAASLARDTRSHVGVDVTREEGRSIVAELQEHRAVMARLKAWAEQLRASGSVGQFIAQELEDRIAGRSGK